MFEVDGLFNKTSMSLQIMLAIDYIYKLDINISKSYSKHPLESLDRTHGKLTFCHCLLKNEYIKKEGKTCKIQKLF